MKWLLNILDFFNWMAHIESQRYCKKYTPYKSRLL